MHARSLRNLAGFLPLPATRDLGSCRRAHRVRYGSRRAVNLFAKFGVRAPHSKRGLCFFAVRADCSTGTRTIGTQRLFRGCGCFVTQWKSGTKRCENASQGARKVAKLLSRGGKKLRTHRSSTCRKKLRKTHSRRGKSRQNAALGAGKSCEHAILGAGKCCENTFVGAGKCCENVILRAGKCCERHL